LRASKFVQTWLGRGDAASVRWNVIGRFCTNGNAFAALASDSGSKQNQEFGRDRGSGHRIFLPARRFGPKMATLSRYTAKGVAIIPGSAVIS